MRIFRDPLHSTLRFIARHVEGFYPPLVAFVSAGFVFAVITTVVFGAIAHKVHEGDTQAFDVAVLQWFFHHRNATLDNVMLEITALGSATVVNVVMLITIALLWQTGHRKSLTVLVIGAIGGAILNAILKAFFNRPRPLIVTWVTQVHSTSFPSGHAMESLIVYGAIAYVIARLQPASRTRYAIWGGAALIIAAIGTSRMYLGVHYPSDVIAGYCAGLAWLAFLAGCMTAFRYFAHRRMESPQT